MVAIFSFTVYSVRLICIDPGPLASLFPLGSSATESRQGESEAEDDEERALESLSQLAPRYLKSRAVVSDSNSDIPRPGSLYARYRHESDLPDTARSFYETAANVTGISLSTLVRCVSQAEIQINKWLEGQRRMKHFAEQSGMDSEFDEMDGLSQNKDKNAE